jgi:hypothetical protein
MTIITKGMGAIIKGITKGTKTRKLPLKKKKKSLLDVTPRKVIKSVAKDVKAATKNKTLIGTGIAAGVNEVVKNEKKKD